MAGALGAAAFSTPLPAMAEETAAETTADTTAGTTAPGQDEELAAVVVTGSRIQRRDYESNSPIVTVGEEVLEQSSTTALESNLNKLPQFSAAQTPTTTYGDIQQTATNTPGAASVALRGIGTNRNLVLLDGRRATPGNAAMVVDINTIPAAAIDRVEIITGGASSTYGADAVGGVVNFILKKNFQGLQVDGQYGLSEQGDANEYDIGGILGANFSGDRGNVTISFSKQNRRDALRGDRSWFRDLWRDPSIVGTEFFPDFPAFSPIGTNTPSQDELNNLFSGRPSTIPDVNLAERVYFNPDGTAFTGFAFSSAAGAYRFAEPVDGLKWKRTNDGLLSQNFLDEQLQVPLDRSNIFLTGNYDINEHVGVFMRGMFNRTRVNTVQQPSPAVNGWSANIPVDGRAIPADLAALLASRDDPDGDWQLYQYMNFADRTARTDVFTWNMLAGLQGKLFGGDWTWEAYGSQGESQTDSYQTGFQSLDRYRTIIEAPNWGAGFTATGNGQQGGFGASTATCTSGLDPFMPVADISADCIEAISADIKSTSTMKQTIWEADAQGGVLHLPAGQLRAALGATYRRNDYEFLNDTLTTQGRSFLDQAIGLYPSGNSIGSIHVKELYGELLVPVLAGLPAVQHLDLELGARTSDYSTTGNSFTWKSLLSWQPLAWARLRGGFNRAERAPNIGELYLAPQQSFAFSAGGDVCSLNNTQPWSANPAAPGNTAANAAAVQTLCRTLMNRSGDPTTADNFYGNPALQLAGGGFVFPTTQGNPDLSPETAKTWTLGTVLRSPFQSPALQALDLALDYYRIAVDHAIGVQSYDIAQRQCFDTAFNPALSPDTVSCRNITRNITVGTLGNVAGTYVNNGRFRTSGVDLQLDWSMQAGPGKLGATAAVNYLIDMKSAGLPVTPLVDYAGTFGGQDNGPASTAVMENGLDGNFFRWRMFDTVSYGMGPWNATLQWQHLPKIKSSESALNPATTISGAPAYDLFGVNGSWHFTDKAMLRAGIDNIFNKAPPISGVNSAPPPGTLAGGGINVGTYDALGRRYYLGARVTF
ncbi:MAG TPA: TonB-dependent receptor [Steroidobacteraceae bacterium]|nr:TonB-dependent receptor [Steroidobacteraceae bacterium]